MGREHGKTGRIASAAAAVVSFSTIAIVTLLLGSPAAHALPSYARQTGQECAACHNGFPELTPYGRLFKMNGYTFTSGQSDLPPLAAMVIPSYTHFNQGQPGANPGFGPNDNFMVQTASLFYGGAIAPHVGAFIQGTYDNVPNKIHWDNTDIRYAQSANVYGDEVVYGVSLSNNPTVTDPWNSTPAWSFPFVSTALSPVVGPAVTGTLIEGGFAQQVLGATAYGYWNRLVYFEAGGYGTLTRNMQTNLGIDPTGTSSAKGVIPYWRLGVEPKWGRNSWEVGTFGLYANLSPGRVTGFGTDHTVDVGIDTQYQWLGDRDSFSLQSSYVNENQSLSSSFAQGASTNSHNNLHSFKGKVSYWRDQTYGATIGYFHVDGSGDPLLFSSVSATNSPNTHGWIGEVDYVPFAHGGPSLWPWFNLKLGLQYVYYQQVNGGTDNFDGAGHNASDNNTLFLFAWLAF